ncbi:gap junction delta-4 protein [Trichomycterus rosablanca]|uniref:gap junction delta-4 protein n=1 Tax=Trichomycterus rosablanca TaxID=2290929 RepID=UPI002F353DCE
MGWQSSTEAVFIALNYNITIVGKIWLVLMVFLRMSVLFMAGYPLYQDEQERFVCNTIQPGCANLCYDIFAPLSLFRFWLVQLTSVCLPVVVFIVFVIHKLTSSLKTHPEMKPWSLYKIQEDPSSVIRRVPCYSGAYIFHLLLRTVLEAGFGAAHYYLFGFHIPRRFMCQHAPCTTMVDCYISRPTEKTIMLNFMIGLAALSLLLNIFDLICAIKQSISQKSNKIMMEKMYEEERYFFPDSRARGAHFGNPESQAFLVNGSFQKRISKAGLDDNASVHLEGTNHLQLPAPHVETSAGINLGVNGPLPLNGGPGGYLMSHEEATEHEGSEVALCPPEPLGTPRSIRVNKRSRLKPLPPPRKDIPSRTGSLEIAGSVSGSPRKKHQYKLPEMSAECDPLSSGGDGCEKRSAWV